MHAGRPRVHFLGVCVCRSATGWLACRLQRKRARMAEHDSDYDVHNASGGTDVSGDEGGAVYTSDDNDNDPLVSRYRARTARTEAMAEAFEELEAGVYDGEDGAGEVDNSLWGTCVANADRCVALCGFTPGEFIELFSVVEDRLHDRVGRGKRSRITKQDRLLLLLVFLKHYESNKRIAETFGLSKSHAQNRIAEVAEAIGPTLWRHYVESIDIDDADIRRYPEFPDVVAMVDVTAQPIWAPAVSFEERRHYFSGKHRTYAFKTQCLHALDGRVVHIVTCVPGATHDLTIAQVCANEIRRVVRPVPPHDPPLNVDGSGEDEPDEPARVLLADSGYQGLQHIMPCILPFKRRLNRPLTADQRRHNRRVARRRVLVENYYGRMKRRYRIMTDKYRGERHNYELYLKLCVALTNFHVMKHPLRAE